MHDYPDWRAAIAEWLRDFIGHPAKRAEGTREIEELLAKHSEDELRAMFSVLGTDVVPADDGLTHREWLGEVLQRIGSLD